MKSKSKSGQNDMYMSNIHAKYLHQDIYSKQLSTKVHKNAQKNVPIPGI